MDTESLQEVARLRAHHDVKSLKKVIKDFYALADPKISGQELQAAHETFMMGLDQLAQHLSRTARLQRVTEMEVAGYVEEAAATEATSTETSNRLIDLTERLREAQQERARRIEYDTIAKTIGKLPDREKGKETKEKLVEDIATLKEEEETYAGTWKQRREAFDQIVDSLEKMGEALRDEKAEQERRRALDEDDNEVPPPPAGGEGAALDPNAKPFEPSSTAKSTPQPGEGEQSIGGGEAMEGVEQEEGEEREEGEA
ncbi:hypothetical protein BCR35DRAFT_302326 [Leucosporidium creatinivorum]|uniref:Tho complex subunit 7-domain-containing protein n=1 Tax=Leucosporidium creatinivorum TaxID=106004 RepID=A0A1Y2FWH2_9BASI|nr:hypothetical protein BCR35DRAFT_302326 [Leucosporidium creatinivorum]